MSTDTSAEVESRPCKACGRKLFFVRDAAGTLHPLDAVAPVYRIDTQLDAHGAPTAIKTSAYVSHFATCPSASQFSRRKTDANP